MVPHDSHDSLEGTYGDPILTTFMAISTLFMESAGNLFLLAIIAYEKYGVDPQKRTVMNQLLAQLCGVLIFGNILEHPWYLLRYLIGPLRK